MKLYVAATGSTGNTYVLSDESGASLILDAGVPIKKVLPHIPDLRQVSACLITHEHMDHCRAWNDYALRGIRCYASEGTCKALGGALAVATEGRVLSVGPWAVLPFKVQHDAVEPFGFLIRNNPTGETIVYATDTYYLRYTFLGVNYWIVECNYCDDLVDEETDAALRNRLKESHMSLRRLIDTLAANDLTETALIVLVHLSDKRSDEQRMVREIYERTGIATVAASAGMTIDLYRTPF